MTPATMKRSSSIEPSTTPLPPASPQSILKLLSRSTILFPKTSPYPRGTTATPISTTASPLDQSTTSPYPVLALSSHNYNFHESKAANHEKNATENNSAGPSGSNGANDKRKKSVRFQSELALCGLKSTPLASDTSSEEKQIRWYGAADFDRFRHDAAADAGVRILRSGKKETARDFVVVGDFDGRFGGPGTEDGATGASKKAYYNENEYGDSRNDGTGEFACRRGLGHHFSRARRRSRAVGRSAVVAWQRKLRAGAAEAPGAASRGALGVAERTRVMLAMVAARCSRTAREEATWRGDVDYRVAHPERHASIDSEARLEKPLAKPLVKLLASAESDDDSPSDRTSGKRDRNCDIVAACDSTRRKRQRMGGGRRDASGGALVGCFGFTRRDEPASARRKMTVATLQGTGSIPKRTAAEAGGRTTALPAF